MAVSQENVKRAFDEGRFLDVVKAAKNRKNSDDRLLLGISLFKLGRYSEAAEVLEKIADQAHSLTKAFYYLGKIYFQQEDDIHGKSCIQKYLAFYPEDDDARDLLEKPVIIETMMMEPSIDLAKIYAQQGHYEQALDIYEQVDKISGLNDSTKKEAEDVQKLYIMKNLQGWLERLKK